MEGAINGGDKEKNQRLRRVFVEKAVLRGKRAKGGRKGKESKIGGEK